MTKENLEKITIYPRFTIPNMTKALGPHLFNWTHARNIAYSLQFLVYCEDLIENKINIKYSIDSMFAKAMTVVAASIIECLLFDALQQRNSHLEKWVDINDPTELPVYKERSDMRVRVHYQEKQEKALDKYVFFSTTIRLAFKEKIITKKLKEDIDSVKNARDLIHIRGSHELDLNKIDLSFYYKKTRPTLIKVMRRLKLKEALELFR